MERLAFSLLACVPLAFGQYTVTDPFNAPQTNCNYSLVSPFSNCDVIGDKNKYDIEKVDVRVGFDTTTVRVYLNYGGGSTLAPFSDGLPLRIGDFFLYRPGTSTATNVGSGAYGVVLNTHGAFVTGGVYAVGTNGINTATADQLLNNTGYVYRRNVDVLMTGAAPGNPLSLGTVNVSTVGNGTSTARFLATIQFANPANFFNSLINANNEIAFSFSSAICANDLITGTVSAVPEPAEWAALIAGLGLIGVFVRRRRHGLSS
ncbi:MAG: PEP-CTERM sorting domain-containing protein [Bryobacteraceae bacterium]|nr:PEP-CTERM sorting domain-containing protein [Bryobacteraceae bacterium]